MNSGFFGSTLSQLVCLCVTPALAGTAGSNWESDSGLRGEMSHEIYFLFFLNKGVHVHSGTVGFFFLSAFVLSVYMVDLL